MRKTYSLSFSALLLTMLWVCQASWAAQIYINETRDIILRSTPSNQGRLLAKVPEGLAVEVLKTQGGWSQVRISEQDGTTKEGWVQSRFLGTHPPIGQEMEMENASLKERLDAIQKEKNEIAQREKNLEQELKTTGEKLSKLEADYEELKKGSANYLDVKAKYDSAKAAMSSAQENVQTLIQENENLKLSQKVQWFATGAMVLLIGWLIGLIMGRSQKKRRTYYRF